MSKPKILVGEHEQMESSLRSYVTGFGLSIILTLVAYLLVTNHAFSKWLLVGVIITLAVVQFAVQLLFFLHLSQEARPRWRLQAFLFMLMVVLIIVIGSLWIMAHLNYHMTPQQQDKYLQGQDGL